MAKSPVVIVVIDDLVREQSPLIVKLKQEYEEVQFYNKSDEGIGFIQNNLDLKIIVILDIKLSGNDSNGHIVLEKLRQITFLIPVIIWSATDEKQEPFSDFINNRVFAFVKQSTPVADIITVVKAAELSIKTDIAASLEDWISLHPQKNDKPYIIALDGQEFSLIEILHEIRQQTTIGKQFSFKLNKLTVDLLVRNKEKLND